ncbi:MAG: zinc-binding dehydrogenase [Candidatus Handelsmanbacteria bacterium]|nr:zinc-binding dehydrogenase [Candidatus Handelsmanbacteria bacterium]
MKGLVKYARGQGHMEVREVGECPLEPGELRIRVEAAGICGSDLHIYHDQIAVPIRVPVVLGHEFSGRVVEVGEGVSPSRLGQRVTAMPSVRICGVCRYCRQGSINLCIRRQSMGYWHDGAFAPTCAVPERCVMELPEGVDFRAGALAEPLACAVHAVCEQTRISAGDLVAIVGPGTIGLLCLQVVKAEGGIALVCGLEQDRARLELARQLGADHLAVVDREDAVAKARALGEGYGADVVLECSGHPAGARLALELVAKGGRYTQVGLFGEPIEIDLEQIAVREIRFSGSFGQKPTAWKCALKLLETGRVDTRRLITHEVPLEHWREAFDLFERQEGVKLLLDVKGSEGR